MKNPIPEFYCPYSDKCYQCCLDTEMTLSEGDITRIEKLGYEIDEFLEEKDGFMTLRNNENHCIFLKDKKCSIYENRPQGCRFYPLIYDFEIEDFVLDNLCDHHEDFDLEIYRPLFDSVQVFVYNLMSERDIRMRKTMEEESKVESEEEVEDPETKEINQIESDKEKIERLMAQVIDDVKDENIENLEEALKSEMREIEEEIEELEKGIQADVVSAEEYIKITEKSIKSEIEDLEKRRNSSDEDDS